MFGKVEQSPLKRTSWQLLEEKAPVNDLGKNLLVPSNTAGCKTDNGVISLLRQLCRHCNNDRVTNFHDDLIQLRWSCLEIFVSGDAVTAQTCELLSLSHLKYPFPFQALRIRSQLN